MKPKLSLQQTETQPETSRGSAHPGRGAGRRREGPPAVRTEGSAFPSGSSPRGARGEGMVSLPCGACPRAQCPCTRAVVQPPERGHGGHGVLGKGQGTAREF